MDPTPLVGAYKRYKAGTKKVIQWLSDTARDCDPSTPQVKKTKKPQALEKLTTDQLIPLARRIVSAKDPIAEIPLEILDCAKDTITGRQQAALWYADKGDTESNSTHRYFLNTLEEIFELLRREVKSRRPKRKKKIDLPTDSDDLGNVFLHLELEDPSIGESESSPGPERSSKTPHKVQQPVELELSADDLESEKRFAIWCLMDDFYKIRVHVRGVWQQYKLGDLSLVTACEITNRAINIMCVTRDEFTKEQPTLETWNQIMNCIGAERYTFNARGVCPWVCSSKDHEHQGPSVKCHADRLCMPAWSALQDYQELIRLIKTSQITYTSADRPFCIFKGHPFARALLNITAELVKLASSDYDDWIFDKYTGMLLRMAEDTGQTFGPHTLVSTQIYLEIYDVLGAYPERGMLEASATISEVAEISSRFDEFARRINTENSGHEIVMDVTGGRPPKLCRRCKVNQDKGEIKGWTYTCRSYPPLFVPSNVLATFPIFCGVVALREQNDLAIHGSHLCDANQFLLASAHLYKAAIAQGSLNVRWDDMEFLIAHQKAQGAFVRDGEGQETVEFVAKQYCLALGLPLTQVAGKHHPKLPSDQVCSKKSNKMHIVSTWLVAEISDERSTRPFQFFYECARIYMSSHRVSDKRLVDQWERTKKLTPCQLLSIVQTVTVEDEPHVGFNFYRLAERAIELTMNCCDTFLRQKDTKLNIGDRWPMPYVITNEILWAAASAEIRGIDKSVSTLHLASQRMQDSIKLYGREGLDQALPRSSGHIPEEKKPVVRYNDAFGAPGNTTSFTGSLEIEYDSAFETAYVPTRAEEEIMQDALTTIPGILGLSPFTHAGVYAMWIAINARVNARFQAAGIGRAALVTLEEDLTPTVRSIGPEEWIIYNHPEALYLLQYGLKQPSEKN